MSFNNERTRMVAGAVRINRLGSLAVTRKKIMEKRTIVNVAVLGLLSLGSAAARDASQKCAPVLSQRTVSLSTMTKRAQLAWMKTIDNETYERNRANLNLSVPGIAEGSYGQFDEKRSQFFSAENYTSDFLEASQEYISEAKESISAWTDCMKLNSRGLFTYVKNVDEDGATLAISWNPAPGLGSLNRVEVDAKGIKRGPVTMLRQINPGDRDYILERRVKNGSIRSVIRARTSGRQPGEYTADIYIPSLLSQT
jgi:hypothetical protein